MFLSPEQLYLLQLLLVALLNGTYLMIVGFIVYLFITRRGITIQRKITFSVTIFMYTCSTVCLICLFLQGIGYEASIPVAEISSAAATTSVLFAEGVLVWRVWVVWSPRRWAAVVPATLVLVGAALGYYSAWGVSKRNYFATFPFPTAVLCITNNALSSLLIAGRIWFLQMRIKEFTTDADYHRYTKPTGIPLLVIESGSLFIAIIIATIVLDRLQSDLLPLVLGVGTQIVGIVPAVIMVLVHLDIVPGTTANKCYNDMLACQEENLPEVIDITLNDVLEDTLQRNRTEGLSNLSKTVKNDEEITSSA